jgi:hypothetical protein
MVQLVSVIWMAEASWSILLERSKMPSVGLGCMTRYRFQLHRSTCQIAGDFSLAIGAIRHSIGFVCCDPIFFVYVLLDSIVTGI